MPTRFSHADCCLDTRGGRLKAVVFPGSTRMKAADFFVFAKKHQTEMVDVKFVDLLGSWQHCSFPIETWDEGTFEEGLGFDGSSIRGWKGIHESDMMAVPDPDTVCLDPFFARPTVSIIANVVDPVTRQDFSRDPRHVARKAEAHLRDLGIADICYVGPEPEFFIFDEVRYEQNQHKDIPRSIRSKAHGTRPASRSRTSVTSQALRAGTFRSARPTLTTISAERWSTRCARSASSSKRTITKLPPRDKARST